MTETEHQDHSAEVDARREAALRRALTTPPKPHKDVQENDATDKLKPAAKRRQAYE